MSAADPENPKEDRSGGSFQLFRNVPESLRQGNFALNFCEVFSVAVASGYTVSQH
jgi:hypothetical protein